MKASKVYLRAAAEMDAAIDRGAGSGMCLALRRAGCLGYGGPEHDALAELFWPRNKTRCWYWYNEEDTRARVFALLFMHQIALDEERA